MYGDLRRYLGDILRSLVRQKESEVLEGHLIPDHVHMLITIPPKYSVSQIVGYIKGKSAIHIARNYLGQEQNFGGYHFWARGYYVSTAGMNEGVIREYIKKQAQEDKRIDQFKMFE